MKKYFPIFDQIKNQIYFDSAATTHKPACVINAISNFYSEKYATVHRGLYDSGNEATVMVEDCRKMVGEFIHAKTDEVIFTHSTTESLNLIAYSYGDKHVLEGDEVLVCIAEHHSNYLPWKMLCDRKKASFKTFALNEDGTINLDDMKSKISNKTKIVAVAHQSNVLGLINPIREIADIVHTTNAILVVDGAQMIAHGKVDVKKIDADFYAFSGHKMYGPTGVGVLYGKIELLKTMDPFHGGGGMVESISDKKTVYRDPPHRFEAGTPMIASIIGLNAAIKFIQEIGYTKINAHEKHLSETLYDSLQEHVQFLTPLCRGNSILSFTIADIHPLDLSVMLSLDKICLRVGNMCAQPLMSSLQKDDICRLSIGLYNDENDIKQLLQSLSSLKQVT
ncbi:MAG: putative cysteine desulfurase [Chlamydiia bacterium]|nr:putative cysteine desulfurase [Chlamydiia bacterium]